MDSDQFDALVSRLSAHLTRRRLGVIGMLGVAGAAFVTETDARKHKKKKKKKKKTCPTCPVCQQCQQGACRPIPNGTACGAGTCQNGACACPTECCSDQDCAGGATCLANGSCALTCTDQSVCPGDCICSLASVEGSQRCVELNVACEQLQPCSLTVNCPEGTHCQPTNCPDGAKLCFPLCKA